MNPSVYRRVSLTVCQDYPAAVSCAEQLFAPYAAQRLAGDVGRTSPQAKVRIRRRRGGLYHVLLLVRPPATTKKQDASA